MPITYGTALSETQLNATGSVSGTTAYSLGSGTVLSAGVSQALQVTFTPTDTVDYTTATATVSIDINQATPTITWTSPAPITYGTALNETQLNATGSVSGMLAYSPVSGTMLNAGASQALQVSFTPTDTVDYTTATGYGDYHRQPGDADDHVVAGSHHLRDFRGRVGECHGELDGGRVAGDGERHAQLQSGGNNGAVGGDNDAVT